MVFLNFLYHLFINILFFDIEVIYLLILFFNEQQIFLLFTDYISLLLSCNHDLIDLL